MRRLFIYDGANKYSIPMDKLPSDPYMLLSVVNMKLRDSYSSLSDLCDDLGIDAADIEKPLAQAGFTYDSDNNRFS